MPGEPLPKARTTQRGKWLDSKARASLEYQQKVAQYARLIWRVPSFPDKTPVEIKCVFFRRTLRAADRDNLVKSIQDGLERAGIVRKDHWIIRGSDLVVRPSDDPHVRVFLCEADPSGPILPLVGESSGLALKAHKKWLELTAKLSRG